MLRINHKIRLNSPIFVLVITFLFHLLFKHSIFSLYVIPALCVIWLSVMLFLDIKEKDKKGIVGALLGILYCMLIIIWPY